MRVESFVEGCHDGGHGGQRRCWVGRREMGG